MTYNEEYNLVQTKCYKDGELHCHNGPAIIYFENGEVLGKRYFINGKEMLDELQIMIIECGEING